jgi:hypothetical protein
MLGVTMAALAFGLSRTLYLDWEDRGTAIAELEAGGFYLKSHHRIEFSCWGNDPEPWWTTYVSEDSFHQPLEVRWIPGGSRFFRVPKQATCLTPGEAMERINRLPSLEVVMLEGRDVSDATMMKLELPHLQRLDLRGTTVTGRCFAHLAAKCPLQSLTIEGSPVKEDYLGALLESKTLVGVELERNSLSDRSVEILARHRTLTSLTVTGALTDRACHALAGHPRLTTIGFLAPQITTAGLRELATIPNLYFLRVARSPLGDDAVDVFLTMPRLRMIDVEDTKITGVGIARLRSKGMIVFPSGP